MGPGRPREFDPDNAIQDALTVFKTHGYAATSIPDLMKGTGLSRGSLYKAFNDKHSLFLRALDRYALDGLHRLRRDLDQKSARVAVQAALLHYASLSALADGQQGCLLTAAATECLPEDEEVRARVRQTFEQMQIALIDAISRGQTAGEIGTRHDAATLARFLLCTMQGMRVIGKIGPKMQDMVAVVAVAMDALD